MCNGTLPLPLRCVFVNDVIDHQLGVEEDFTVNWMDHNADQNRNKSTTTTTIAHQANSEYPEFECCPAFVPFVHIPILASVAAGDQANGHYFYSHESWSVNANLITALSEAQTNGGLFDIELLPPPSPPSPKQSSLNDHNTTKMAYFQTSAINTTVTHHHLNQNGGDQTIILTAVQPTTAVDEETPTNCNYDFAEDGWMLL
jgi:hypothetical protein